MNLKNMTNAELDKLIAAATVERHKQEGALLFKTMQDRFMSADRLAQDPEFASRYPNVGADKLNRWATDKGMPTAKTSKGKRTFHIFDKVVVMAWIAGYGNE